MHAGSFYMHAQDPKLPTDAFCHAFSSIPWQVRREVTHPCTWLSEEGGREGGLLGKSEFGRKK